MNASQTLRGNVVLQACHFASTPQQNEMDVFASGECSCQPQQVVHVLGYANISAIHEDEFVLQAGLGSPICFGENRVLHSGPVIKNLQVELVPREGPPKVF